MLKAIEPLLHADLLYALAQMGHGDELAVVDRNYPAVSTGQRVVRLDGAHAPAAVRAILSVFSLDTFVDTPVHRMAPVHDPEEIPDVQQEVQRVVAELGKHEVTIGPLDRFAFYERSRGAFATVTTTEARLYGCFILTKGVV